PQNVWVRLPGEMRVDRPDGAYEIVRNAQAWLVNEKANRVTPEKAPTFPLSVKGKFDFLSFIKLPDSPDLHALLTARPAREMQLRGRSLSVYAVDLSTSDPMVRLGIEARVDATTHQLVSFKAETYDKGDREDRNLIDNLPFN